MIYEGFATKVLELSRSEQAPSPVLFVNTCCVHLPTCYHVSELQECFLCNLCNIPCFSGFTDKACEPFKIMFVIPSIDSSLGAN